MVSWSGAAHIVALDGLVTAKLSNGRRHQLRLSLKPTASLQPSLVCGCGQRLASGEGGVVRAIGFACVGRRPVWYAVSLIE